MRGESAKAAGIDGRPVASSIPSIPLRSAAIGLWLAIVVAGCAPLQRIPIEAGPGEVELFVDGERVAKTPDSTLELRADRSHVLMFRKAGHRPEQRVLESSRGPDGPQLSPGRIRVELEPLVERDRKIQIELDPDSDDDPGEPEKAAP